MKWYDFTTYFLIIYCSFQSSCFFVRSVNNITTEEGITPNPVSKENRIGNVVKTTATFIVTYHVPVSSAWDKMIKIFYPLVWMSNRQWTVLPFYNNIIIHYTVNIVAVNRSSSRLLFYIGKYMLQIPIKIFLLYWDIAKTSCFRILLENLAKDFALCQKMRLFFILKENIINYT